MSEHKPIVLIKISHEFFRHKSHMNLVDIQDAMEEKWNDYHILVIPANIDSVDIQVFYDKDFTETNYKELKQSIEVLYANPKA